MTEKFTRRRLLEGMSGAAIASLGLGHFPLVGKDIERTGSPYGLKFSYQERELTGDLDDTERGDPRRQSESPHGEWYSREMEHRMGAWGPKARHYAPLEGLAERPLTWKRERVIAVAKRYIGYGYQHHHIPDWDPPAYWPWKETCVGHNGKGFDCSNFTSFVYNQGFGIRMNSAIARQAELSEATEGRDRAVPLHRVRLPESYEERRKTLRTGDLLFILGKPGGHVTHVVIWVGDAGTSPSGVPLILDSHGGGVDDDNGRSIPCGVQLRPFRERSWYNRCASHAHRVFHESRG